MALVCPMRFEAFVVDNETIAKELYFRPPNTEDALFGEKDGRKRVYSVMLDKVLNVDNYSITKDKNSIMYIFTIHSPHHDISLIVELFNMEMQIV